MSFLEKAISFVAPGIASKRAAARAETTRQNITNSILVGQFGEQGYGKHGASRTRTGLKAFTPVAGDAKADIENNAPTLRARARDLYMGGALSNGALKAMRTNIIGTGLRLKSTFDSEFLNLSDEQSSKLRRQIEREWNLWAESKDCDAVGIHNIYELQQLAFLSWLMSGDVFVLLPDLPRKHATYDLRIKIIEADRCSSPGGVDTEFISSGVERDSDGMIVAYHFSDQHPSYANQVPMKWTRVAVRGEQSGRINVIHLMDSERPEQIRGVPILAPVIESLKQLERFTDAELNAAVITSMFTVFVTKQPETDPHNFALESDVGNPYNEPVLNPNTELKMGYGAVNFLEEGESVEFADPTRPNAMFDPFVMAILRQIGASLEVPYELLLKNFTSSYSASRGALLEAWKMFKMRRAWMSADFCQPIYEEFFTEAVIKGRIDAPGLFSDPLVFRAYTKSEWHGPSYGMLDPVKEVQAAVTRMENGLSTGQREAAELTGTEYESNVRQRAVESKMWVDNNLSVPGNVQLVNTVIEPEEGGEEEDDSEDQS